MFDMFAEALPQLQRGNSVVIATVTATKGSSPRQPGAAMLVLEDGSVFGSVSGGCVEGAVYEMSQQVLNDGVPVAEQFGFSDDDAFAVGLTCGGILDIFIRRFTPHEIDAVASVVADVEQDQAVAVATVIDHPNFDWVGRQIIVRPQSVSGTFGSEFADHAVEDDVRGQLASGASGVLRYGAEGERMGNEMSVSFVSFQPKPRMVIFGAIDFAAAVAAQSQLVGFHVTVCDARPVFATSARFPGADEVVARWPHQYLADEIEAGRIDQRTAVCVLTHDAKFDVPLLTSLLKLADETRPHYIGVMGSRRTHEHRLERLKEAGVTESELTLMKSPIGLDIKGVTPAETAVSILAEVIATRWGGSGAPLSTTTGRIHSETTIAVQAG